MNTKMRQVDVIFLKDKAHKTKFFDFSQKYYGLIIKHFMKLQLFIGVEITTLMIH